MKVFSKSIVYITCCNLGPTVGALHVYWGLSKHPEIRHFLSDFFNNMIFMELGPKDKEDFLSFLLRKNYDFL